MNNNRILQLSMFLKCLCLVSVTIGFPGKAFPQNDSILLQESLERQLEKYGEIHEKWIRAEIQNDCAQRKKNSEEIEIQQNNINSISDKLVSIELRINEINSTQANPEQETKSKSKGKTQNQSNKSGSGLKTKQDSLITDLKKEEEAYLIKLEDLLSKKQIAENESENKKEELVNIYAERKLSLDSARNLLRRKKGAFTFPNPGPKGSKTFRYFAYRSTGKEKISLHFKNPTGGKPFASMSGLLEYLKKNNQKVEMITNAGMFTPTGEPKGLYIENGKTLFKLDKLRENPAEKGVNFYLQPNGVFYLDINGKASILETAVFFSKNKPNEKGEYPGIKFATQSGPMLISNGIINKNFTSNSVNRKIRSGVGLLPDGTMLFLCTEGDETFYNFSVVFRDYFGCRNALFLDGAISKMYLSSLKANDIGGIFGPIISVTK
jgi:uncharacterized protein YigE (DUF2233 family)